MRITPLLAAAALSLGPSALASPQSGVQTVQVWSYGFAPRPIYLAAGRPVTLTFVNRSGSSHDFVARRFFANATITSGRVENGEVDLRPHETVSVTLVPRAGTYHAHCSHFFHKPLGMSDTIIVR